MADFADLKSIHVAGHSTSVAALAMGAAEREKLNPDELLMLHVAALAHDLGRVSVSAAIWDKSGPLNDSEWEAVRLHPCNSERLLSRARSLAQAGQLGGTSSPSSTCTRAPSWQSGPSSMPDRQGRGLNRLGLRRDLRSLETGLQP